MEVVLLCLLLNKPQLFSKHSTGLFWVCYSGMCAACYCVYLGYHQPCQYKNHTEEETTKI